MKRMLITGIAVVLLVVGGVLGTPDRASANSQWCSPFNIASGWVLGWHCSKVTGSGTWIDTIWANFGTYNPRQVCNWRHVVQFWDSSGRYQPGLMVATPTRNWCSSGAMDRVDIKSWRSNGTLVCVTLQSYGSRVTSECHRIHS